MAKRSPAPPDPPPVLATLPTRLKYARERAGITQAALSDLSHIDASQISRIENGERTGGIEAATIIRLAQALGIPVGWLAADEGEIGPVPVFREGGDRRRKSDRNERPR